MIESLNKIPNLLITVAILDKPHEGFVMVWHTLDIAHKATCWTETPNAVCLPYDCQKSIIRLDYTNGWYTNDFNSCDSSAFRTDGWVNGKVQMKGHAQKVTTEFLGRVLPKTKYEPNTLQQRHTQLSDYLPLELRLKMPRDALDDLVGIPYIATRVTCIRPPSEFQ